MKRELNPSNKEEDEKEEVESDYDQ